MLYIIKNTFLILCCFLYVDSHAHGTNYELFFYEIDTLKHIILNNPIHLITN